MLLEPEHILNDNNNATWTLDIYYLYGLCEHEIQIYCDSSIAIYTLAAVVRWGLRAASQDVGVLSEIQELKDPLNTSMLNRNPETPWSGSQSTMFFGKFRL